MQTWGRVVWTSLAAARAPLSVSPSSGNVTERRTVTTERTRSTVVGGPAHFNMGGISVHMSASERSVAVHKVVELTFLNHNLNFYVGFVVMWHRKWVGNIRWVMRTAGSMSLLLTCPSVGSTARLNLHILPKWSKDLNVLLGLVTVNSNFQVYYQPAAVKWQNGKCSGESSWSPMFTVRVMTPEFISI